jgi:tetratricopeptide (TPR) repeat protein
MKKILILFSTILLLSACGAQKTKQHGNINPPSQVELGKFYFSRGEFDNAARAFSMALKSNPDNATLYFYHGQALARLKLYSKAIDDFSQAIDLKKDFINAYINKALAYASINNFNEAQKILKLSLNFAHNNPIVFYNLGIIALNQKYYDYAINNFSQAIDLKPNLTNAYINRGIAYLKTGVPEKAVQDLTQAVALNPADPEIYYNRALVYENLGEIEKALADYSRALAINPEFAAAYNNRGLLRLRKNMRKSGCADLEQACELGICERYKQLQKSGECFCSE